MITVTDLTKTFRSRGGGTVTAVDHVSFTFEAGQFASIVGTSGSGKTTLLSLLGGLERPSSGQVQVEGRLISHDSDGRLIDYRRRTVGFVFQNFSLIPNLSARENVMLQMEFATRPQGQGQPSQRALGSSRAHRRQAASASIETVRR